MMLQNFLSLHAVTFAEETEDVLNVTGIILRYVSVELRYFESQSKAGVSQVEFNCFIEIVFFIDRGDVGVMPASQLLSLDHGIKDHDGCYKDATKATCQGPCVLLTFDHKARYRPLKDIKLEE